MTTRKLIIATLACCFSTASLAALDKPSAVQERLSPLQPGQSYFCPNNSDGTFTDIVTTMASVLPPEGAENLLNTYLKTCTGQKVSLKH